MREISSLRFRGLEQARSRAMPGLPRAVSLGEIHEEGRPDPLLQRGVLQLQSTRRNRRGVIKLEARSQKRTYTMSRSPSRSFQDLIVWQKSAEFRLGRL